MKLPREQNLILQPAFIFAYLGFLGYVIFFLLRPSFDITAGAPMHFTGAESIEHAHTLNRSLGFNSDTLSAMTVKSQNISLYDRIRQIEYEGEFVTPQQLNRSGVPLMGWRVTTGRVYDELAMISSDVLIYEDVGITQTIFDQNGNIIRVRTKGDSPLHAFAPPTISGAASIITDFFGYSLRNYSWADSEAFADTLDIEIDQVPEFEDVSIPDSGTIRYEKINPAVTGPEAIALTYRIDHDSEELQEQAMSSRFVIEEFSITWLNQDPQSQADQGWADGIFKRTLFIFVLLILVILILGTGLRQVFRGRVEWMRAIIIFAAITLGQFFWVLFYMFESFYQFLGSSIIQLDLIQQFFLAGLYGLYGAMAYISWESLARELRSGQIPVIDAVWSGKIFRKQVGAGILTGYGIAGFVLGIVAVMFYSFQGVMLQYDSLFGLRDITTSLPSVMLSLNAWLTSMLIIIPKVGVIYCLISKVTKRESLRLLFAVLLAGFTLFMIGYFFDTNLSDFKVFIMYLLIAVPVVLAYRYFGVVSAIISWFVVLMVTRVLPMLGSENTEISMHATIMFAVLAVPFVIGFVGLRFGKDISSASEYVPDYQEKEDKHARTEKELAIAKESQFALLPTMVPELSGLDIRGFFVPSHEVGGDFYDYTIINGKQGQPEALVVSIVDVSGKAMQSAFNAVFTSGLLLGRIQTDLPEKVLSSVNPILCKKTDPKTFITCQIGRIDLQTRVLRLANAGHCKPLLKRNGSVEFLETKGPRFPLGLKNDVDYEYAEIQLQKGDILLFYSDGLPEAKSPDGKRFEFEDVRILLQDLDTGLSTSREICDYIKKFILDFSNYELADDTTVVCVKVE